MERKTNPSRAWEVFEERVEISIENREAAIITKKEGDLKEVMREGE